MSKLNLSTDNGRMYYDFGGNKLELFNSSTKKFNSDCIDFSKVFTFIEFDTKYNETNKNRLEQYGDLKTLLEKNSSYDKGFYHYTDGDGNEIFLMNFGNGNVFKLTK